MFIDNGRLKVNDNTFIYDLEKSNELTLPKEAIIFKGTIPMQVKIPKSY